MRSIGIYEGRIRFSPEILLGYTSHYFAVRLRNRFAVCSAQDDTGGRKPSVLPWAFSRLLSKKASLYVAL